MGGFDEDLVGVKQVLNFKDLSYEIYLDGELHSTKFLTKEEALNIFPNLSKESKNKILNYDNRDKQI